MFAKVEFKGTVSRATMAALAVVALSWNAFLIISIIHFILKYW